MNTMTLVIFIALILVVFGMIIAFLLSEKATKKERSMAVIKGQSVSDFSEKNVKDDRNKRRAEIARKLKEEDEDNESKKKTPLSMLLAQGGLSITPRQFWIFSCILAAVVIVVSKVMGASNLVVILVGITGLLGLPRLVLRHKIKKRQKQFLEEFADALEAMVRLLKAGMPVTEAISMAGKEYEGPVGDEMSRMYDAQKVGIPLSEAAMDAAKRMPLPEMQMFATGIVIQSQTGASLSEVLMNLAGVIRARYRLKRKVQALSSEAKSSAAIIGALPFLIGGGLFAMNPEHMSILYTSTGGKVMLVGGAIWMSIGIMVMKVMINFKI